MTLLTKIGSFVTPSSTGSQVITGVGFTAKALLFWATKTGVTAGFEASLGFASSSTALWSAGANAQDGASSSNTGQARTTLGIIRIPNSSGSSSIVLATISSFDADGFTLSYSATTSGYTINYLALGGTDITNALVDDFARRTTVGTQSITLPGFQSDLVLFIPSRMTSNNTDTDAYINFGAAKNSSNQFSFGSNSDDGAAFSNTARRFLTGAVISSNTNVGAAIATAQLTSMTATGFDLSYSVASGSDDDVGFLAIKGPATAVGTFNVPASTGSQIIYTEGVQPKAVILFGPNDTTVGSIIDHVSFSYGASDGTDHRAIWAGDVDNVDVTVADSAQASDAIYIEYNNKDFGTATLRSKASISSLNDGSFTLNWTQVDGGQNVVGYVVIGTPSTMKFGELLVSGNTNFSLAPNRLRSGAMSWSGATNLTLMPNRLITNALAFSSEGVLTTTGTRIINASIPLTTEGVITFSGALDRQGTLTLSAEGVLTTNAFADLATSLSLSSTGEMLLSADRIRDGALALSGETTITYDNVVDYVGSLSFASTSDLTIINERIRDVAVALSAESPIVFDASALYESAFDLLATSEMLAEGQRIRNALIALSAQSDMLIESINDVVGEAAWNAISEMLIDGDIEAAFIDGEFILSANGEMIVIPQRLLESLLDLSATSSINFVPSVDYATSLIYEASSDFVLTSERERTGHLLLSAEGIMTTSAAADYINTLDFSAQTIMILNGLREMTGEIDLSATSAMTLVALREQLGAFSWSATSDVVFDPSILRTSSVAFSSEGILSVDALRDLVSAIDLSASSSLQIAPTRIVVTSAGFEASTSLNILGGLFKAASVDYSASTDMSVVGSRTRNSFLGLSAQSDLIIVPTRLRDATIPLTANTHMIVLGTRDLVGTLVWDAQSNMTIVAHLIDFIPTVDYFFNVLDTGHWYIPRPQHMLREMVVGGQWFVSHKNPFLNKRGGKPFFVAHHNNNEDLP